MHFLWDPQSLEILVQFKKNFQSKFSTLFLFHVQLLDDIRGCIKRCPFCKVMCTSVVEGHEIQCRNPQHYPIGMQGYRKFDKFVIQTCNSLVASTDKFRFNGHLKVCHKKCPCYLYLSLYRSFYLIYLIILSLFSTNISEISLKTHSWFSNTKNLKNL